MQTFQEIPVGLDTNTHPPRPIKIKLLKVKEKILKAVKEKWLMMDQKTRTWLMAGFSSKTMGTES